MASLARRFVSPTLLRFLAAGGISYLVNQASLYLLYEHAFAGGYAEGGFDAALLVSSLIAVEWSILVRFWLNNAWTFRGCCRKPLAKRFYQFNLSSFGSPLISLACVNLLTPWLGVSYLIANSLGILLGLAWNWGWARLIWKTGDTADRAKGPQAASIPNYDGDFALAAASTLTPAELHR